MSWTKEEAQIAKAEYHCDQFARRRGDYKYVCRQLGTACRLGPLAEILDLYVRRVHDSHNTWVKWSEAELEFQLDDGPKKRLVRSARAELIRLNLLIEHPAGRDSRGVLTCRVNFDLIQETKTGWTKDWRDTVKAKPRGRVVSIDRDKSAAMPDLFEVDEVASPPSEATEATGQVKSAVVDLDNTWEKIRAEIDPKIGPGGVSNWLNATAFDSLIDGALTVTVPNPTTAEWIEQEYSGLIETASAELNLGVDKVQYRVKSAPVQNSLGPRTDQTQFQANSADPSIKEKNQEEKLASQLSKLTRFFPKDAAHELRVMKRAAEHLEPRLQAIALERFQQKMAKRDDAGPGLVIQIWRETLSIVASEHQPVFYWQLPRELQRQQMEADEKAQFPDREIRRYVPQPIRAAYGTPQFLPEWERCVEAIPRKAMGREESAHSLSMGVAR